MISKNLLIPSKNLPFGMMIFHLLRYLKINLSSEAAFAPSVNIDRTLLKRMQVGTREHVYIPQAPHRPHFDSWSSSSSIQDLMDKLNYLKRSSYYFEKFLLTK